MANPFNIPERTLNQLGDSTNTINVVGGVDGRTSVYEPLVCIATDHVDTTVGYTFPGAVEEQEAYLDANCVIFVSKRHGEPWTKGSTKDVGLAHILHQAAATPAVPTDVSVLYPNFDYTTFE